MPWSCHKDCPGVLGPTSVCAWCLAAPGALLWGSWGLFLGTPEASTPCPGYLLATRMGRRTEEGGSYLLPVSLEDAPGRTEFCFQHQGVGGQPCPALALPGWSHGSSSRLGVLGHGPQKGVLCTQTRSGPEPWLLLENLCCGAGAEPGPHCRAWGWVLAPSEPRVSVGAAAGGWFWALLFPPGLGQGPMLT